MLNRKGFTLIELLIVVVIIGILAAIAIPKFANTKEKAYIASMKSDLHNLINAQEAYFADSTVYTDDLGTAYAESAGVTVTYAANAGLGWTGTATHTGTNVACNIYLGADATTAGEDEGTPICQ